jgi:hypothetical protein
MSYRMVALGAVVLHHPAVMAEHVLPMPGRMVLMARQRDARLVANHAPVGHGAAAAHRPRSRMRFLGMRARSPAMRMRDSVVRVGALAVRMAGLVGHFAVRMTGLAMRHFVVRMAGLVVRTCGPMMAERDPAVRVRGPSETSKRERCAHHHGTVHDPLPLRR